MFDNKYLKLLKGTIIAAAIIWGIYELPHGFLLLYPIGASIWAVFLTIDHVDILEVTHLIALAFAVFMPMITLEILIIFSLFYDFSMSLLHLIAFIVIYGWYSWGKDLLKT